MVDLDRKLNIAVIVAHPDDETLWTGGFMLAHPNLEWFVISLCRESDPDRAPKYYRALRLLNAKGAMSDLDDGPNQTPLSGGLVEKTILEQIKSQRFDLIISHGPRGEYTRHRRHEETSQAVRALWKIGALTAPELWLFAYDDQKKTKLPQATTGAHRTLKLSEEIWGEKYRLVTQVYGFDPSSWEARTTPHEEAFWCFDSRELLIQWENAGGAVL